MSGAEPINVRERLAAGPRRGLGCAAEIAEAATDNGDVLRKLVEALKDGRSVVVARAANALKTVQRADARALDGFAGELVQAAETCPVLEARWNILLLLGRVRLTKRRKAHAVDVLISALGSRSALERVHALDALTNLSVGDTALQDRVRGVLERALLDRSAAVRARARSCCLRLKSWPVKNSLGQEGKAIQVGLPRLSVANAKI